MKGNKINPLDPVNWATRSNSTYAELQKSAYDHIKLKTTKGFEGTHRFCYFSHSLCPSSNK